METLRKKFISCECRSIPSRIVILNSALGFWLGGEATCHLEDGTVQTEQHHIRDGLHRGGSAAIEREGIFSSLVEDFPLGGRTLIWAGMGDCGPEVGRFWRKWHNGTWR